MCDTLVALGNVTANGVTLFGKNSDREPNEAHHLLRISASDHPASSKVKCTYIEIPQVAHTYEVLLAKPFWTWGAEMGANEHGGELRAVRRYVLDGSLISLRALTGGFGSVDKSDCHAHTEHGEH